MVGSITVISEFASVPPSKDNRLNDDLFNTSGITSDPQVSWRALHN